MNCGPEVDRFHRLKSGTAQKLILNMISTGSMVRTGKGLPEPDGGRAADQRKLHTRAENIVIDATGVEREKARAAIDAAGGGVKTAITMLLADCDAAEAARRLERATAMCGKPSGWKCCEAIFLHPSSLAAQAASDNTCFKGGPTYDE